MERVAIFIDGGYLSKVLMESFSCAKIDFAKLSNHLANGKQLLRTYYYHCMPYKDKVPTAEQIKRFNNMQRFITSLEYLDRYKVRLGKLEYRGQDSDGAPIYQQKRVDILLGCDLVLLAAKRQIGTAIIVTGDSDFIPAIDVAINEGVEIELVYDPNHQPHKALTQIADVRRAITQDDIDAIRKISC